MNSRTLSNTKKSPPYITLWHKADKKMHSNTHLHMKVKVGLVGLPNVGKSTLFNSITQKSIASAENFPFCTITPNVSPIPLPDKNLHDIADIAKSKKVAPARIELIDVAGLVKGASRGEGLGNQFLATVRECHCIIHVLRSYINDDIVHVHGEVDPLLDAEVVSLELLLADLDHVKRRLDRITPQKNMEEKKVLEKILHNLEKSIPARCINLSEKEQFLIKSMGLLTLKPVIYAFNVDDVDFTLNREEALSNAESIMKQIQYQDIAKDKFALVSAKFEEEFTSMNKDEQIEYLNALGIDDKTEDISSSLSFSMLPTLAREILDLSICYTGPGVPPNKSQTTKSYLFSHMTAYDLAGRLHGDILRGFIRAEVINTNDFLKFESYNAAKESGFVRVEGKDYVIQSEDIVLIKWR